MAPAERADVVVDFTHVPCGRHELRNMGPDEPFGGGEPGSDFDVADPATTGGILQFRVGPATVADPTTPPRFLRLPAAPALPAESVTRPLALLEKMSDFFDDSPAEARLGTVSADGHWRSIPWEDAVTENPTSGSTEVWEFYNVTADAHPIHMHEVAFEVVNRQGIVIDEDSGVVTLSTGSTPQPPEPSETGYKDTVLAYPGQVTRVRATFGSRGQYVWHCHIVEHEDNEMMRPYRIGPLQSGQPTSSAITQ